MKVVCLHWSLCHLPLRLLPHSSGMFVLYTCAFRDVGLIFIFQLEVRYFLSLDIGPRFYDEK